MPSGSVSRYLVFFKIFHENLHGFSKKRYTENRYFDIFGRYSFNLFGLCMLCWFVQCVWLFSCAWRTAEVESVDNFRQLQQAMVIWKTGDTDRFDAFVREQNNAVLFIAASTAYVQRGRLEYSLGDLYTAKQFATQCLSLQPNFMVIVERNGGTINKQAIDTINQQDASMVECVKWLGVSWALWLQLRGAMGASEDIPLVQYIFHWVQQTSYVDDWAWYGRAVSSSLGVGYRSVDWQQSKLAFDRIRSMDSLAEFEYNYYYLRYIQPETYCASQFTHLPPSYVDVWQDSLYICP